MAAMKSSASSDLSHSERSTPSDDGALSTSMRNRSGDLDAVSAVDEERYVQHNPHTLEGSEGLAELFVRLSKTSPRVQIVRAFEDDDFVFAHTEYDFADRNVGFEVFRFEDGQAVEHRDNIQSRLGPNPSGHTMTDGPTEASDLDRTEANRHLVRVLVQDVLVGGQLENLANFVDDRSYAGPLGSQWQDGTTRSTAFSQRATSSSACLKASSMARTPRFVISTELPTSEWLSTGPPLSPSLPGANGATTTESSQPTAISF
ncbi:MAG: putative SnoaL-like aldol condensation-catalyzing enzyme [Candidatus Poriferisodalaceae bacterium]|jgi:predicted SnoaL-like aldol condensation-catalyzing enzyme